MAKRLLVDLDICDGKCPGCVIECSYFYHPFNNGITELREKGAYALVCRRCEQGTCVLACPFEALKKGEDGLLKRSGMLCAGCRSCVIACPFGTLYEETIPFLISTCDACVGRANGDAPLCVRTCPYAALKYAELEEEPGKGVHLLWENVLIHATAWKRD